MTCCCIGSLLRPCGIVGFAMFCCLLLLLSAVGLWCRFCCASCGLTKRCAAARAVFHAHFNLPVLSRLVGIAHTADQRFGGQPDGGRLAIGPPSYSGCNLRCSKGLGSNIAP
eukprot:5174728-Amphidinium_carterae.1